MELTYLVVQVSICLLILTGLLYGLYEYVARRRIARRTPPKTSIYACGEEYRSDQASLHDRNLGTPLWRIFMRQLYHYVRDLLHTGVLSDWFLWMYVLLTTLLLILTGVLLTYLVP